MDISQNTNIDDFPVETGSMSIRVVGSRPLCPRWNKRDLYLQLKGSHIVELGHDVDLPRSIKWDIAPVIRWAITYIDGPITFIWVAIV